MVFDVTNVHLIFGIFTTPAHLPNKPKYFGTMLPAQIISQSTLGPPFRGLYLFYLFLGINYDTGQENFIQKFTRFLCLTQNWNYYSLYIQKEKGMWENFDFQFFFFSQLLYFHKNFTIFHIDLQILFGSITIQCVW